jgi:O-antigen/teichoic acid export membrane protein
LELHLLAKNIVTLFILQMSVYFVPLITTPYLARTLGVANFGLLGVAAAIISYVSLVSDWGFGYTATREAARHAGNPAALHKIFWDTILAKTFLCGGVLMVFLTAIIFVPQWHEMLPILLVYSLSPLTAIFGAGWFLQGLEKMVHFTAVSLVGRLTYVPLIFAFVHSREDVLAVAAIQSGTSVLSVIASIVVANRVVPLLPVRLDLRGAWQQIKAGSAVFLSTGGINLYNQSNIILIGMIAGPIQAGLFTGADKIQRALQSLTGPISGAVYPRINNLLVSKPKESHRLMRLTLVLQGVFSFCLSVVMFLSADFVTRLFLGNQYIEAVPIIRCLAAVLFLVGLNNALGVNMMFPFGLNTEVARITVASGIFNVAMLSFLTYEEGAIGAAISVVMTEMFVTLGFAWSVYAKRRIVFAIRHV